ncbi:MAG: VWA domain-containing protein [Candidatus Acidiferrales bacterium]
MILRRDSSALAPRFRLVPVAAIAMLLAQSAGSQDAKPTVPRQATTASQPPQAQGPPITSDTKLVTMLAAVRDKHGNFVRDLKQADFSVQQDGHPQTITYFAQDPNIRLTVGLLVDTSLSQRRVLDQERSASGAFLDKIFDSGDAIANAALASKPVSTTSDAPSVNAKPTAPPPPRDQAFIVRFDYEVELEQDITPSRQKLEAALRNLNTPEFSSGSSSSSNPDDPDAQGNGNGGSHHRGGRGAGTLLYDAIYLSSEDLMKKQQGRKALVLLTDGDDRGSKESLENAIESAQRADTLVYSILFKDNDAYGNGGYGGPYGGGRGGGMGGGGHHGGGGYPQQESRPDGKKVLERISRETGGRFFEVTKKQSIDDIYTEINDELRSQYSIGYKPEPADAGPGYHKIQLSTNRKDLAVQTREGYYAK